MRKALIAAALLALVACGGGNKKASSTPAPTPSARPASSGKLAIVSPRPGDTVKGTTVTLRLTLTGAKIVPVTTKTIRPDEGHLHVLLDGRLITMTASLETLLPGVSAGSHTIRVEFVAGDHAPFDPRVVQETLFTVTT